MTTIEVPLRHQLLHRSTVVGSAWALPRAEGDRLWRNLGESLSAPTVHVPGTADLTCRVCGATWVGRAGESCDWCEHRKAKLLRTRRMDALTEPAANLDGPLSDIEQAAAGWAQRLAVAVKENLVTSTEADGAVKEWLKTKANQWQRLSE